MDATDLAHSCFYLVLALPGFLLAIVLIAARLANWRYGVALRSRDYLRERHERAWYIRLVSFILAVVQIALCFAALQIYGAYSSWLRHTGFLPLGWS